MTVVTDPLAVVADANQPEAPVLDFDGDRGTARVEAVFEQFLDYRGRALNDLAGMARVLPRVNAPYAPPPNMLATLDSLWPVLDAIEPVGKELLIEGLVAAISSDGQVAVEEAELLRVVCASLHCPLPPMLEQRESRLS
mgnify:CR=1 FL=1